MIDLSHSPLVMTLPISFLGGIGLGYVYFRALRATTDQFMGSGQLLLVLALTFGRSALVGAGLYVAVLAGALALLSALAGILCAKAVILYQMRSIGA